METHFQKAESENYYGMGYGMMTNLIICALFLIRSGILLLTFMNQIK